MKDINPNTTINVHSNVVNIELTNCNISVILIGVEIIVKYNISYKKNLIMSGRSREDK